jgi:hypothetical protein
MIASLKKKARQKARASGQGFSFPIQTGERISGAASARLRPPTRRRPALRLPVRQIS